MEWLSPHAQYTGYDASYHLVPRKGIYDRQKGGHQGF